MSIKKTVLNRKTRNDKFKIPFALSEEQIAVKLGWYFGLLEEALGREFELIQSKESVTGADHEYKGVISVYYLQAKAPIGLLSKRTHPPSKNKKSTGYNLIRDFRDNAGLESEPYSLCFGLRKPAKHVTTVDELQHNLLYKLHNPHSNSYSMYIAPTVLESEKYKELLKEKDHRGHLYDGPFFGLRDEKYLLGRAISKEVMGIPFLQAHICIVPHAPVTTHKHYYSYSINATDVAFHSPKVIVEGIHNLSDFLSNQIRILLNDAERRITSFAGVKENIKNILPISLTSQLYENETDDQLSWIISFGKILKDEFGIEQYLLLKKSNDRKKIFSGHQLDP